MIISSGVTADIKKLVELNLADWKRDAREYGYIDLTIAVNDEGDRWNYQTGDNSYTGGAYGLPHWAVVTIDIDTDRDDLVRDIFEQFSEIEVMA